MVSRRVVGCLGGPLYGWLSSVLVALALTLSAGLVHAQMTPQQQFEKGQTLFDAGDFEQALPFFKNAFERTKSPNASLYVARCLERLERFDEAYTAMKATVTLATDKAKEEEKYVSTRDAAAAELAVLAPKVGLVVIAFTEELVDAVATLDGRALDAKELGVPVAVMPGEVTVVGSAEGRETVTKVVTVEGGETKAVALALPEASTDDPGPSDEPDGGFVVTPLRAAGFAVGGLGVVGLVVFAVTGSMASSKFSQLEEECGGVRCTDPAQADVVDEGKTLSLVANVTAGVGGALLLGGVLMVIFGGPDDEPKDPKDGTVSLVPTPGGLGVAVSF